MNNDKQNPPPLTEARVIASEHLDSTKERVLQGIHEAQEKTKQVTDRISDKADETIHKVADTLNTGGDYLNRHGIDEIQSSLTKLVRRHPYVSLVGAFALGMLVVMATTPRR